MRYFIRLSYDGHRYHGWQVQPNGLTVEETLERALATLLRRPVDATGAGRTDAGVSASMMVAHFDWPGAPLDGPLLSDRLNRLLPADVAVQAVWPVGEELHARFSATSRTYHYYVATRKDVFAAQFAWHVRQPLDFALMNRAAAHLLGTHDFTSFSKVHTDVKTMVCRVTEARWEPLAEGSIPGYGEHVAAAPAGAHVWRFTITADRFLRNMVRAVVGTLAEVGRGRMDEAGFLAVMRAADRCEAGQSVPGHALFLSRVTYPDGWLRGLPASLRPLVSGGAVGPQNDSSSLCG